MDVLECRYTPGMVELRAEADKPRIGGYAVVYGRLSRNLGGFVEEVAPVALNRSRGQGWPDVRARYNHDPNMLLGTTAAGTLRLYIDETGLRYEIDPPAGRADVLELVQRGDIRHSSFAFRTIEEDWGVSDQGYPKRTLLSVQLVDVAPVSEPAAYPDATAALRSLSERFDCALDEVRSLAEQDDLRKFFVRKDQRGGAKPKTLGAAARMELLGKEKDPWA